MTVLNELFSRAVASRSAVPTMFGQGQTLDVVLQARQIANCAILADRLERGMEVAASDVISGHFDARSPVHSATGLTPFISRQSAAEARPVEFLNLNDIFSTDDAATAMACTDEYVLRVARRIAPEMALRYEAVAQPLIQPDLSLDHDWTPLTPAFGTR